MASRPAYSTRLGFLGLGAVGRPMARNALDAGWPVAVHDSDPAATSESESRGATAYPSPAELARHCDVVQIAVATVDQLRAALLEGRACLLAGAHPGLTCVIHGSVGADICMEIDERARELEVRVVDAPVTGPDSAPASAARREVTYIVGASPDALEAVRPCLELSGHQLFHVGRVGDAQIIKLAANALALVQMQATHETLQMFAKVGVDEAHAIEVLQKSSASNWAVDHWAMVKMASRAPASQSSIPRKDLALATQAARDMGLRLAAAESVSGTLDQPGLGFLAPAASASKDDAS